MLQQNLMIGGPGHIVEIDETLYHWQSKFHVGQVIPSTPWLFGAINRNTKKVSVFVVGSRTAAELDCILPGSTIHLDEWQAYNNLRNINGYTHRTVCHKDNLGNPADPNVHTQNIEGFWAYAKSGLKEKGLHEDRKPDHVDELVFRWTNKDQDVFEVILRLIAQQYSLIDPQLLQGVGPMPAIQY